MDARGVVALPLRCGAAHLGPKAMAQIEAIIAIALMIFEAVLVRVKRRSRVKSLSVLAVHFYRRFHWDLGSK